MDKSNKPAKLTLGNVGINKPTVSKKPTNVEHESLTQEMNIGMLKKKQPSVKRMTTTVSVDPRIKYAIEASAEKLNINVSELMVNATLKHLNLNVDTVNKKISVELAKEYYKK